MGPHAFFSHQTLRIMWSALIRNDGRFDQGLRWEKNCDEKQHDLVGDGLRGEGQKGTVLPYFYWQGNPFRETK